MMNRLSRVMKIHSRDLVSLFFIPFMVLGSSFIVNLVTALISGTEIYTGGILSILIYIFVMGITILAQTFPFAISFSIRRVDYVLGTIISGMIASGITALVLTILALIESKLAGGWWVDLHFFSLPYINDGNVAQQFFMFFSLCLFLFLWGFVIGSIYRRFRGIGMLILLISSVAFFTIMTFFITRNQWWIPIFDWFSQYTSFQLALWMLPVSLLFALLSFLLLRRSII